MGTFLCCNSINKKEPFVAKEKKDNILEDSSTSVHETGLLNDILQIDPLEVIVVQCANGYEYAQHGYDFNPIIEKELNNFENITIKPFPLKTLMGVSYQGVFDKKYCPPIIEKVSADYLILTRFDREFYISNSNKQKWGYELRVVNTKTLEQITAMEAHNLKNYTDIEKHIKHNIGTLKIAVENLK
ncbi:hypothetical protein ACIGCP_06285 [Cellulophaga baltica]|uniref:hypothetical protein n=1 Tax=Cellulophaga baltica TaxID=76594 RepID=UPI0037C993D6